MAETGTSVQETPQNGQQALSPELQKEMQTSLAGFVPGIQPPASVTPGTENQNSGQQPAATAEQQQAATQQAQQQADPFGLLKEKFGWEKPEDAVTEVEQLRQFKATPPVSEPIKYENEQSEKIAKALQAGKLDEVFQALSQQQRLNSLTTIEVNKDNAPDIIKLGMQLKYKDLSAAEIDYKFGKQYGIPKEPVQGADELDEVFEERKATWKEQVSNVEMEKIIDAKTMRPELELAKTKIVFPEVEQTADEDYLQYQKNIEDNLKLDAETKDIYQKFTPKTFETKIKFTDEPNKIDFEFQHEPDAESFKKTIDITSDITHLIAHFKKSDGTPDREGFAKAMYYALNYEKALLEAIKQSKNATIKSFLPDNGASGTQRQFPQTQEMSELDKQMQASLNGFAKQH